MHSDQSPAGNGRNQLPCEKWPGSSYSPRVPREGFTASSVAVLGGSSEIASGILTALPGPLGRVVLADLPSANLDVPTARLRARGVSDVDAVNFDARDISHHGLVVGRIFEAGPIDLVIVAFGHLEDQRSLEDNPDLAANLASVNYVGSVSVCLHVARHMRAQSHGAMVVLSSSAAVRPHKDNFIYASSKAGLDAFARGLGDSLRGTGVSVLVVRPGFVPSPMTRGRPAGRFATDPASVGKAVVRGLNRGREVIYSPAKLKWAASLLNVLPPTVVRRLPT